jgi:hypothetical protein
VIETAVVGGNDLVCGLDHFGVDQTLDGVSEDVLLVNWLHGGFGDFQHDRPVWASLWLGRLRFAAIREILCGELDGFVWLVIWGVVGEDGGTVEWAVILREVQLQNG